MLDDEQAQSWFDLLVTYGPVQLSPDNREAHDSSLHNPGYVASCAIVAQSTLLIWLLCFLAFKLLEAWPRPSIAIGVTVSGSSLLACKLL